MLNTKVSPNAWVDKKSDQYLGGKERSIVSIETKRKSEQKPSKECHDINQLLFCFWGKYVVQRNAVALHESMIRLIFLAFYVTIFIPMTSRE